MTIVETLEVGPQDSEFREREIDNSWRHKYVFFFFFQNYQTLKTIVVKMIRRYLSSRIERI